MRKPENIMQLYNIKCFFKFFLIYKYRFLLKAFNVKFENKNICTFCVIKNRKVLKLNIIFNKIRFFVCMRKNLVKKLKMGVEKVIVTKYNKKISFKKRIVRRLFARYLKTVLISVIVKIKIITKIFCIQVLNYKLVFKKVFLKNKKFKKFKNVEDFKKYKRRYRTIKWFYFMIFRKLNKLKNFKSKPFFIYIISHSKSRQKIKKLRRK